MAPAEADRLTPELSVVVPARNEAKRLAATFEALAAALDRNGRTEFIFVLDATSSDDTVEVGKRLLGTGPELRLEIVNSKGKGGAVAAGVRAASGEIVLIADADLSVDPRQFASLIAPAAAGALAIASRGVAGSQRIGEPVARYLFGRAFNLAVRALILPGVRDTQCGFKAFPRKRFASVFGALQSEGWCFDVEVIASARKLGVPVVEVPVRWHYGHGSKLKLTRDAPKVAGDLFRLRRRFGRIPSPQFRDGVTERP